MGLSVSVSLFQWGYFSSGGLFFPLLPIVRLFWLLHSFLWLPSPGVYADFVLTRIPCIPMKAHYHAWQYCFFIQFSVGNVSPLLHCRKAGSCYPLMAVCLFSIWGINNHLQYIHERPFSFIRKAAPCLHEIHPYPQPGGGYVLQLSGYRFRLLHLFSFHLPYLLSE